MLKYFKESVPNIIQYKINNINNIKNTVFKLIISFSPFLKNNFLYGLYYFYIKERIIKMISITNEYYNEILYEAEMIDRIKHFFNENFLDAYKNKIKLMRKSLIDAKVDLLTIEKIVKKYALEAAGAARAGNYKTFDDIVKQMFSEIGKTGVFREIGISLLLVLVVVIINNFCVLFLISLGITPLLIFPLTAVFCAPLVEETGKYLSVKYGAAGVHFIVFNLVEFTYWLGQLIGFGVPIVNAVISRLITVFLHLFLTAIHIHGKEKKQEKQKYLLAVGVHSLWNFIACLPRVLQSLT